VFCVNCSEMSAIESKLSDLSEALEQLQMPTTPIDVRLMELKNHHHHSLSSLYFICCKFYLAENLAVTSALFLSKLRIAGETSIRNLL